MKRLTLDYRRNPAPALCLLTLLLVFGLFLGPDELRAMQEPDDRPVAAGGVMDIRGWSMPERGILPLDGDWEMLWSRLAEPVDWSAYAKEARTVPVPSTWGNIRWDGRALPDQGYATYRLTLRFAPEDAGRPQALYIRNAATAYRLWIDGKPAGGNGEVGTDRSSMRPVNTARTYVFTPGDGEVELLVQVSNFVQRKGGLWDGWLLGTPQQIGDLRERRIALQLLMSSSLLILGLYHLLIYIRGQRDPAAAYFGTMCAAMAGRAAVVGETLAVRYIPAFPWELAVKLEYFGFLTPIMLLPAFGHSLYPHDFSRHVRRAGFVVGGVSMALVIVLPARVYTEWMHLYQALIVAGLGYIAFVYAVAIRRRRRGAVLNFIALAVLAATAVHDILFYNHLLSTGDLLPYGLFLALAIQTFMLAEKFAYSFKQVERLSGELTELNDTLEDRIRERTAELEEANVRQSRLELSRRRLLSDISHELGTPLTSIQGYVEAIRDGVVTPGDPGYMKYMRIIYDKTLILDRIIKDLAELSRLESGQSHLKREALPAEDFVRRLFEKYELDLRQRRLRFELRIGPNPRPGYTPVIDADPVRLEQVLANFLSNAGKFTPAGGTVTLELEYMPPDGGPGDAAREAPAGWVSIRVQDSGPGIREEDLPHIFERFYRGRQRGKSRDAGTGLGLAISKEIVALHGGRIGAVSPDSGGSVFHADLPARFVVARLMTISR